MMKLWSIQPEAAMLVLDAQHRLVAFANEDHRAESQYVTACRWMGDQMRLAGISLPRDRRPLWAWWRWAGKDRPRPDLRASGHLQKDEIGVLLDLQVPSESVLLSDFDRWHCLLNGSFCWDDDRDYERHKSLRMRNSSDRKRIMESWSRIFALNRGCATEWKPVGERSIQACLPCIRVEWVRSAKRFKARGRCAESLSL